MNVLVILGQITPAVEDIGFDVSDFVTQGITTLGAVVAVACGGYVAFLLVRKGLQWMRTALR